MNKNTKTLFRQVFILFCIFVFLISTTLLVQRYKKNRFDNGYFVVINSSTGYADKGFNQASILGICAFLGIEKTCNRYDQKFARKVGFGFPGTVSDPKKIYDYIQEQSYKRNTKTFILPGFTFTEFLNTYIWKLQKQQIKVVAIDTFFFSTSPQNWPSNLYQYGFKQQYSGFNAGLYAGLTALIQPEKFKDGDPKTPGKQIRFAALGGLAIPAIVAYAIGFKYAIELINTHKNDIFNAAVNNQIIEKNKHKPKDVDLNFVALDIIGGFGALKSAETRQLARNLYQKKGVSVLFSIAVGLTNTMHNVAAEQNFKEKAKQNWVIGVDIDQGAVYFGEKTWKNNLESLYLTSATINLKNQIKHVLTKIRDGIAETGSVYVGGVQDKKAKELVQIPHRYQNLDNPVWKLWEKVLVGPQAIVVDGRVLSEMPTHEDFIQSLIKHSGQHQKIYDFINSDVSFKKFKEENKKWLDKLR